jgi:glycosyltransferase involved in cell wall biosynthesis
VIETKAALESLGVEVEVRAPNDLAGVPLFDLAHVFNLQMPETALPVFDMLQQRGKPIAFSPIYWDTWAYWFEQAQSQTLWRWPSRVAGTDLTREAYVTWQRLKAPRDHKWKLQRALLKRADRVLPNSGAEGELLGTSFFLSGGFAGKIDVVPNGIDAKRYEGRPCPSRSFLETHNYRDFVLQVGTISPVKNQLRLIDALFDVPVPIVFIGHTPTAMSDYARQCRARADERGNVLFINHLAATELPGIYALAAVHALPSWRETPGLVSLEAAACGCRIVSTSIGSAREYFEDGAWYCHPSDVQSIRTATLAALEAPATDALRRRVLTRFTWRQAGEATLASYERILRQSTPSPRR